VIKINGLESSKLKLNLNNYSAYVQQDDVLYQTFTVRECLEFAAQLKLPGTAADIKKIVDELLEDLKLTKC
jgi:ATP-binding cassette subfamily G (WHITE) protein 2